MLSVQWLQAGESVAKEQQKASDDYEHELTSKSMAARAKRKWLTRNQRNEWKEEEIEQQKKMATTTPTEIAMTTMTALTISDDKPIENIQNVSRIVEMHIFLRFFLFQTDFIRIVRFSC